MKQDEFPNESPAPEKQAREKENIDSCCFLASLGLHRGRLVWGVCSKGANNRILIIGK